MRPLIIQTGSPSPALRAHRGDYAQLFADAFGWHRDRFAVLDAYAGRCAICHLRHRELLDAAHIIPDGEPDGLAEVPNGLSLCKLHHAAYDSQAIGITPDRVVRIAPAILTERDGPMLEHGFKAFEGAKLAVPAQKLDWPKAERLAARWEALPWRG